MLFGASEIVGIYLGDARAHGSQLKGNEMFGFLEGHEPPAEPLRMNEIVLAYLGDCVYELYVRNLSVEEGPPRTRELSRISARHSKAAYQAQALKRIRPLLTEDEESVVRRAKNKKITSKPKNADPMEYKEATAFEALIGYLYLTEQHERMETMIRMVLEPEKGEN